MNACTGTPIDTGQGTPTWGGPATAALVTAVVALGLGVLAPSARAYFWEKTHPKATEEMAGLVQRQDADKAYEELYDPAHLDLMRRGSTEEDFGSVAGNARGNRHYYDPDATGKESGLRYQNYFRIWMYIDLARWGLERTTKSDFGYAGIEVNKPPSGYYENALEWARNSAGTGDDLNWEGAIRAYGYTKASRDEAYLRLGHVAHLLADMAEPDHVLMLPHPGSDMRSPSSGPAAPGEVVKYGYEGVVEAYLDTLEFPATQIRRRPVFDDYFNEMARTSKQAFQGKAVPPLGLKTVVVTYYHEDLGKTEDYLIPLLPDIPDTPADRAPYLAMADSLLGHAVELGAGVLQDFHDIVNQPPYVRSVRVSQGPEPGAESGRYECAWIDGAGGADDGPAQGPIRFIDRDNQVDVPLGAAHRLEPSETGSVCSVLNRKAHPPATLVAE